MSKLLRKGVSFLFFVSLGLGVVQAQSEIQDKQAVHKVVQDSVDEMLSYLKNEEMSLKARREGVKSVIDSMADLELLAKLALGKTHWSKIDSDQRSRYTSLFVETIRQSIFEKLELFTDEKVEVGTPVALSASGSAKYKVTTWIVSKGERIELALMLAKREGGWKVYDLEIEGVSTRKSYGSQYADFLREKTFDELLVEMKNRVDESKKKMAEKDAENPGKAGKAGR